MILRHLFVHFAFLNKSKICNDRPALKCNNCREDAIAIAS